MRFRPITPSVGTSAIGKKAWPQLYRLAYVCAGTCFRVKTLGHEKTHRGCPTRTDGLSRNSTGAIPVH